MNCAIDIGNTLIKVGFFNDDKLTNTFIIKNSNELKSLLHKHAVSNIIISNVGEFDVKPLQGYKPLIFNHETKIPISNKYKSPKTLGIDRLAAVIGANKISPNQNVLVIDAGSCITYDYLNSNSDYEGGGISPGIKMKYNALHNFTSKLPLVDSINEVELIGKTTEESIMSGVINGTISEISGIIERYQNISDNFALVFCGGDGEFLSKKIRFQSIYEENLVLIGLNEVLKINE